VRRFRGADEKVSFSIFFRSICLRRQKKGQRLRCFSHAKETSMNTSRANPSDPALHNLDALLPDLAELYKDVHSHPELSMQETRTAGLAADRLRAAGYEVATGIGKTGVVGLLRNGEGPTVMLHADMDALPVQEATGLPYASKITAKDRDGTAVPVGHMCGHDMHVTWLVGATKLLAEARTTWRGTVMAVFQPGEETAKARRP
jgi:metal-dependent amidase/aminoacylase/carboxypeptidase family protein